jgi:uridine phosphorylase
MKSTLYLKCKSRELAPTSILVGDRSRLHLFKKHLEDSREIADNREFFAITGVYRGMPISIVATGIGAPSMAIAIEELVHVGVKRLIRAGTMMSIKAKLGNLVLAQAACRYEGTSKTYMPLNVPAVADFQLYNIFRIVLNQQSLPWTEGIVASCDGFYSQMFPSPNSPQETSITFNYEQFKKWNVLGLDMETSLLYTLARYLDVAAVSLCAVTVDGVQKKRIEKNEQHKLEDGLVANVLRCAYEAEKTIEDKEGK